MVLSLLFKMCTYNYIRAFIFYFAFDIIIVSITMHLVINGNSGYRGIITMFFFSWGNINAYSKLTNNI